MLLNHQPGLAVDILSRPPVATIPGQETFKTINSLADRAGLRPLLEKHLLSGMLLNSGEQWQEWPIEPCRLIEQHLENLDPKTALACPWIQVPIPVVQGSAARVVWMLLGRLPEPGNCRCVSAPCPDAQTLDMLAQAVAWGDPEHGHICWFLQQREDQPVRGSSLGLTAALAASLLAGDTPWPAGLYATGGLGPGGRIYPVGHVQEKFYNTDPDCRLFLYPTDPVITLPLPAAACAALDDATFAVNQYTSGAAPDKIALLQTCRFSLKELLAHFQELPLPFLSNQACRDLLQQAVADPDSSVKPLAAALWQCGHDRSRGKYIYSLFSPADILKLVHRPNQEPNFIFDIFDFCLACIAHANHCGSIAEGRAWKELADRLSPDVETQERNTLLTHDLVQTRFNCYDFRPELPTSFSNALAQEEKLQNVYPHDSYRLGAMYGTLAQNFGFCGPDFLDKLLDAADRAETAFGDRYWQERKRLDNYRIYGLLDAGQVENAACLIPQYLDQENKNTDIWFTTAMQLLSSGTSEEIFKSSLVLRFLADDGYRIHNDQWRTAVPHIMKQKSHPWQLIGLNLARILTHSGQAREAEPLLMYATQLCSAGGETIRPMALLPLAELDRAGSADRAALETTAQTIHWLGNDAPLNHDHFRLLLQTDNPAEQLEIVRTQRSVLFPFSCR